MHGKITGEHPSMELLAEYLDFDFATGTVVWKVQRSWRTPIGAVAGSKNAQGYIAINVGGRPHGAHRLIWLMAYGEWPGEIDHINGDKTDNRLCNLRIATRSQNNANAKRPKTNKSGVKGVFWSKTQRHWRANIGKGGKNIHLGVFPTKEAAAAAYAEAARRHFGEFARIA